MIEHNIELKPQKLSKTKRYVISNVLSNKPADSIVLIDKAGTDYYLEQNTLFIFDYRSWPIIKAQNSIEVEKALKNAEIDYILLERDIEGWWDQIPLYSYLERHGDKIATKEGRKYGFSLYNIR
jgi:hypothetical protein